MARIVELSLNRIFRSRWGVSLVILFVVLVVVGIGRVLSDGHTGNETSLNGGSPGPTISVDPRDNDSILDSAPPPAPSTSPGRTQPEVIASNFAAAWIDHKGVTSTAWHDRLLRYATKKLATELSGVDPAGVPADRLVGRPSLVPVSESVVTADISMDSGKLSLRLVAPDGQWLVDGIDWTPA